MKIMKYKCHIRLSWLVRNLFQQSKIFVYKILQKTLNHPVCLHRNSRPRLPQEQVNSITINCQMSDIKQHCFNCHLLHKCLLNVFYCSSCSNIIIGLVLVFKLYSICCCVSIYIMTFSFQNASSHYFKCFSWKIYHL